MKNKESGIPRSMKLAWLGLAIILLAAFPSCGRKTEGETNGEGAQGVSASVAKAVREDLANNLEIASEFRPFQEIEVHAKVSGYVQKLYVDWGSHVKKGELLAVLEIPELEDQINQDKAALSRSEEVLARAKEEIGRTESAHTVVHGTYSRLEGVAKTRPDLVAQEELDVAKGKDSEAEAQVSEAKSGLAVARGELEVAKASLAKDQTLFAYSRITAPFTGVVTNLYAFTGALLPAGTSTSTSGQALVKLSQNNLLRLVIPIPETVVPKIRAGDPVKVRVSAINREFTGTVVRFSGEVDEATRTMHTEVDVPNPDYILMPGMYASVEIPVEHKANTLTIPIQSFAASTAGRGTVLVVNAQNQIEKRDVSVGIQTAERIEVLDGVKEKELVVVGNQGQYRPGETVRPLMTTPAVTQGEQ